MKNSIILLTAITLTFFMTSCSDDSDLTMGDTTQQNNNTMEIDPETGEEREVQNVNFEDVIADSDNQLIDLTEIIEADILKSEKSTEKSIARRIYSDVVFVSHGGWKTIVYNTRSLGSCYNNYRVTVIPYYGDPDLSIWAYDHSGYNKWRKVKIGKHIGRGKEEAWFKRCNFRSYEEKAVIGIFADKYKNTKFKVIIDRIS